MLLLLLLLTGVKRRSFKWRRIKSNHEPKTKQIFLSASCFFILLFRVSSSFCFPSSFLFVGKLRVFTLKKQKSFIFASGWVWEGDQKRWKNKNEYEKNKTRRIQKPIQSTRNFSNPLGIYVCYIVFHIVCIWLLFFFLYMTFVWSCLKNCFPSNLCSPFIS